MYDTPPVSPEKTVEVPFPDAVAPPGVAVIVQSPNEGSPLRATLPVDTVHVGWVMAPTAGAAGMATIVTEVVTGLAGQPPEAGMVYVTTYVPSVLVDGVTAPVPELIVSPPVDEYVPPVYEPVPEIVTG